MTETLNKQAASWYEKDVEKKAFLDLVNHQGFILEEVVHEVISNSLHRASLHSGEVFKGTRGKERVEIDLWVQIDNFIFDIESKRSDYDWVFLQNNEESKDVHIMSGANKNISIHNRVINKIACVSKQVIEVFEDNEEDLLKSKFDKSKPSSGMPLRSQREDYVHSALRQALFNTETLIHSHLNDNTWVGQSHRIYIPVIVTNAKLVSVTYDKNNVDDLVRLTKFNEFKSVPFAAVNHSEILWEGSKFENIIAHVGRPASGPLNRADERFKGSHNKTVFVVNKSHIVTFINTFMQHITTAK